MTIENSLLAQVGHIYKDKDIRELSALNLAYIGDAVFEILVRTEVLNRARTTGDNLHQGSKSFVRANAQHRMYHKLWDYLTEEEAAVMKRGRNAKSYSKAKNATINEYRHATGVEALFGYLYLKGETSRVLELFQICIRDENGKDHKEKELTSEE